MNSRWFFGKQNIPREEKNELEKIIRASSITRDILTRVIEHEISENQKTSPKDFSLPGWPYYQAEKIGYDRALKLILEMTKLEGPVE